MLRKSEGQPVHIDVGNKYRNRFVIPSVSMGTIDFFSYYLAFSCFFSTYLRKYSKNLFGLGKIFPIFCKFKAFLTRSESFNILTPDLFSQSVQKKWKIFGTRKKFHTRVYHPRVNLLSRSPGPQPCQKYNLQQDLLKNALDPCLARYRTCSKILLRILCAQAYDSVRMPWAPTNTLVRMPCIPWEKLRIKIQFFSVRFFPPQKCSKNLTVNKKPRASHGFRKRKE